MLTNKIKKRLVSVNSRAAASLSLFLNLCTFKEKKHARSYLKLLKDEMSTLHKKIQMKLNLSLIASQSILGLIDELLNECKISNDIDSFLEAIKKKYLRPDYKLIDAMTEEQRLFFLNEKQSNKVLGNLSNLQMKLINEKFSHTIEARKGVMTNFVKNIFEANTEDSDSDSDTDDEYEEDDYDKTESKIMKIFEIKKLDSDSVIFKNLFKSLSGSEVDKDTIQEFSKLPKDKQKQMNKELKSLKSDSLFDKNKLLRVLKLNCDFFLKEKIFKRVMNESKDRENGKFDQWFEYAIKLIKAQSNNPTSIMDKFSTSDQYEDYFNNKIIPLVNGSVYGNDEAKHKLLVFMASGQKNLSLGIHGPPGVGKTRFMKYGAAEALGRPFFRLNLGGAKDSSILKGHGYTYTGSEPGMIAKFIMDAGRKDIVIFIDELDKVSNSPKGEEIINYLIHATDPNQNSEMTDDYFGNDIPLDLSQVSFIGSFNSARKINRILLDRFELIELDGYEIDDKIKIAKQYLIPDIMSEIEMGNLNVEFTDELIKHLEQTYTFEKGVRKLREILKEIINEINYRNKVGFDIFTNEKIEKRRSKRRKVIYDKSSENVIMSAVKPNKKKSKPIKKKTVIVNIDNYKTFFQYKRPYSKEKIHPDARVGKINGLYATDYGNGGITSIEMKLIPSNTIYGLKYTGNIGKIKKEAGEVAKTVAWNNISDECRNKWMKRWEDCYKESIHIHCAEAATKKDGPSAGIAVTVCIISLLTGQKVSNELAITGEIDFSGAALEIGGLKSKLFGAKAAGVKIALFPRANLKDFEKIVKDFPLLVEKGKFEAFPIDNVKDACKYAFVNKVSKKRKR